MISLLLQTLAILLLLLTLPLTAELALLTFAVLFLRRPKPHPTDSVLPFRLAVIVPAHNQAAVIGSTVVSLRLARVHACAADIRIIVIAHNCTDATAGHARQAGAEVRILDGPSGKGAALAFAFASVPAEGYLIIKAGSIVDPALLQRVQFRFAGGAEAIQCRFESLPATSMRARLDAIAFRSTNVVRPAARRLLHLSCGILGNGFALRRTLLDRIPYSDYASIEDVELHIELVTARIHVRYIDDVAVRNAVAPTGAKHARWESGRLGMAIRTLPHLLLQIITGKLRLLEPALDIAALPIAQQTALLLIALLLPFPAMRAYCIAALLILALHIVVAIFYGDNPRSELRALLYSPIYLVSKLLKLPAILLDTIRTRHNNPPPATEAIKDHIR